ncbi:MAG: hypothetical protein K5777_07365 [Nitrosopumilus sp.]|nr:hypothetical protein [Nitrosopumilus sp.]
MSEPRTRSKAWYILPVFMGIIGGIIAYFAVKRDDPKLGNNCLKVGIVMFVINLSVGFFMGFFSELMI